MSKATDLFRRREIKRIEKGKSCLYCVLCFLPADSSMSATMERLVFLYM